jgi:hypothetical protein
MTEFFETRMGHKFYDVTMPGLVAELARLNALLAKLVEQQTPPAATTANQETRKP